jgi:YegS/Rv2252/BmrU family lipid kinase
LNKTIALITNTKAGSGRGLKLAASIAEKLHHKNISHKLITQPWPEHLADFSDAWIIGGDGTLNHFINTYPQIKIPLVIFPGGSGNDFATLLYGAKSTDEIINAGLNAPPRATDAGLCNERYFINGAGIAFEGAVVEKLVGKNKRAGKIDFLIAILKRVFFYREPVLHIKDHELDYTGKCLMVSVMNGKTSGGGFKVGPQAGIDDGLFEISVVRAVHPIKRLRYLPVIEKGKHINLPFVSYYRSGEILIEGEVPIPTHLDGEYYSASSLNLRILPGQFLFRY